MSTETTVDELDKLEKTLVTIQVETTCEGPLTLTIVEARNLYDQLRDIFEPGDYRKFATWLQTGKKPESAWMVSTVATRDDSKEHTKKATRKKAKK